MKTYKVTVDDYGKQQWYRNNKLHREDGPAIIYSDGEKKWYLEGKDYREEDYHAKLRKRAGVTSCEGKSVIVDGKTYYLREK